VFQVKATVVAFLGNEEVYPCHFKHKIGDEVIFDGESYHGRLCPDVWSRIVPKVEAMHQAGATVCGVDFLLSLLVLLAQRL